MNAPTSDTGTSSGDQLARQFCRKTKTHDDEDDGLEQRLTISLMPSRPAAWCRARSFIESCGNRVARSAIVALISSRPQGLVRESGRRRGPAGFRVVPADGVVELGAELDGDSFRRPGAAPVRPDMISPNSSSSAGPRPDRVVNSVSGAGAANCPTRSVLLRDGVDDVRTVMPRRAIRSPQPHAIA